MGDKTEKRREHHVLGVRSFLMLHGAVPVSIAAEKKDVGGNKKKWCLDVVFVYRGKMCSVSGTAKRAEQLISSTMNEVMKTTLHLGDSVVEGGKVLVDKIQHLVDNWPLVLDDGQYKFPDGSTWPQKPLPKQPGALEQHRDAISRNDPQDKV